MDTPATAPIDRGIAAVLRDFPQVAAAWLFGSEARGDARPDSDIDIALLLHDRSKTARDVYRELATIAARLESIAPGRLVDVVLIEHQGPIFRHRVISEGRLVFEADRDRRVAFEADTCVRYFDWLPTHQRASAASMKALRASFGAKR